jgi:arylsulfatase A-like enzyme
MQSVARRDLLKLLALLPLANLRELPMRTRPSPQPAEAGPPNILILVFDAFSARHVPFHGYRRATTPNLARFAERATVFHSHYAAGSFTTPGTASLLTGTYPWSHRAINLQSTVSEDFREKNLFRSLGQQGYYRLAYSHNMVVNSLLDQFRSDIDELILTRELCLQDPYVSQWLFGKDFTPAIQAESLIRRRGDSSSSLFLYEIYRLWMSYLERRRYARLGDLFPRGLPTLQDQVFLLEDAVDWTMRQLQAMPRPFFAYLHFLPPHDPYHTRSDFVGRFDDGWVRPRKPAHPLSAGETEEGLIKAECEYDEYIAYADAEFGRLARFMEDSGVLDTTYVVVTSDHGELFERGIWGHITPVLFEPLIRVPLLLSQPGQRARRDVRTATSCVDLLPTLLQAAGIRRPGWCEGEVLPPLGDSRAAGAVYCMDAKGSSRFGPLGKRTVCVVSGHHKLVHYLGYPEYDDVYEMYDLDADPQELRNIYASGRGIASDLRGLLNDRLVHLDRRDRAREGMPR